MRHINLQTIVNTLEITEFKWYFESLYLLFTAHGKSFQFSSYFRKTELVFLKHSVLRLQNRYLFLKCALSSRLLFCEPRRHIMFRLGPQSSFFSLLLRFHVSNITSEIFCTIFQLLHLVFQSLTKIGFLDLVKCNILDVHDWAIHKEWTIVILILF